MLRRILLIALLGLAVPAGTTHGDTCGGITFANDTEKLWVQRVTSFTTNLTCLEARNIYRNYPAWRDEIPGNMIGEAGVKVSPAIAEAEAAGATITCTVWTRNKYRAPVIPFGDHVLWSVYMEQSWGYDNQKVVWYSDPIIRTDTTTNGFRWRAGGAPWGQNWWEPADRRIKLWTDRNQPMESWAIHPSIGGVGSVSYIWNWKQWNGDWATSHDTGLAGCRDDD